MSEVALLIKYFLKFTFPKFYNNFIELPLINFIAHVLSQCLLSLDIQLCVIYVLSTGNCIISDDQSSTAGSNRENLKEFDENLQTPVLLERSTSINTSYVETNVTLQDDEIISLDNDTVNMESTYLISAQDMPIVLNTTEPLQNATVIFEKYDNLLEPMMNGTIKLPVVSGDNLASKILVASGDNIASKIIDDATIGSSNSQDSVKDNAMESLILPITSEPHFKHVEELLYIDANADDFVSYSIQLIFAMTVNRKNIF